MKKILRKETGTGITVWSDFTVMLALTGLSVYNGQATVFYIIYLFWWNELIVKAVNRIFKWRRNREAQYTVSAAAASSGPLMAIYWIFIVVIFGFVASWEDKTAIQTNFSVLFFRNVYFNLNILFILVTACLHTLENDRQLTANPSPGVTANMIVLHVSIILGAFVFFMVVKGFPDVFRPENSWSAVLMITPFLLLRFLVHWFSR
ncbi:hypothetical protein [Parasegetibacter sp. NRK P23]|uniref:hypothetical protein n=1 Tax=Parasegetibacter sp. NRK P23 TaxID=2942999 RepID=UPI0020443400|nr:hypothetical protein [Parasegetibacter sp. NRK P23]MCM5529114.1 hypothetical protein [Parasegetibacter sp. NRK P23]